MTQEQQDPLESEVIKAKFFETLGYSTVWEDEAVIEQGLVPKPGDRVLSITSGGCFSLHFLLYGVAEVISIDFNRKQSDLLSLKVAALASLSHEDLWRFLGLSPCGNRRALYGRVRGELEQSVRRRVDEHREWIEEGPSLAGRQDRFLFTVGRVIEMLQGHRRVEALLSCEDAEAQREFYDKQWNGKRWRTLNTLLFNRVVLYKAFDKEHFVHSKEKSPARRLRLEIERGLLNTPGAENFYLHYLFKKTYRSREDCPAWLRASNFEKARSGLDRLRVRTGQLEHLLCELPSDSIDCFNFSNAFDWMSTEHFVKLMQEAVRVARDGARLCYWTNVMNTRKDLSSAGRPELCVNHDLGARLSCSSRTPGYSGCVVALVRKS